MNLKKHFVIIGILGCTAVIFGAFGAHILKSMISASSLSSYKTGILYQFIHTLTAFIVLLMVIFYNEKLFLRAFWCFVIGICLFSGSIYILSLKSILGLNDLKIIGALTPLGGIFFILGWLQIIYSSTKIKFLK